MVRMNEDCMRLIQLLTMNSRDRVDEHLLAHHYESKNHNHSL